LKRQYFTSAVDAARVGNGGAEDGGFGIEFIEGGCT